MLSPELLTLHHPEHGSRALRPKLVQILLCLAERPGAVLQRHELLDRIWRTQAVNEEALTRGISELRTILGDERDSPRYIQTIRGSGYRLVASVTEVRPNAEVSQALTPSVQVPTSTGRRQPVIRMRWEAALLGAALVGVLGWNLSTSRDPSPAMVVQSPMLPIPLTSLPGRETDPAISPDGSRIAFSWGGAGDDNYDIYIKPRGGPSLRRLTSDPGRDVHPAWSPAGRRVAWIRNGEAGASLWVAQADGGAEECLAEIGVWASGLDWSPDGRELVFARTLGKTRGLRLTTLSLEDQRLQQVSAPGGIHTDHSPAYSPAGSRIAFVRSNGMHTRDQVCIAREDGGELSSFDMGLRGVRGLDWVVDEEHLILAAEVRGTGRLYSMATADGALSEILVREEHVSYPSLSNDATILVYEDARLRHEILRVPLRASTASSPNAETLLEAIHSEREAYFSPDGTRIAFISERSGNSELWFARADGSDPRRMTDSGTDALGCPRWSPGGQRIAYQRTSPGGSSLWIMTLTGAGVETVRVHTDASDMLLASWSHDESTLYFGSSRDGEWGVWSVPVEAGSGTLQCVVGDGANIAAESTDGAWLYYSKASAPGIWRRRTDGGAPELVVAGYDPRFRGNWALAADELFFTSHSSTGLTIQRLHCASGELEAFFEAGRVRAPSFSISSRTGELLLATTQEGTADLNLIVSPDPVAFQ